MSVLGAQELGLHADGAQGLSAGEASFGLLLVASGFAAAPLASALLKHFAPRSPVFFARWGFSHLAQVVLVGLGLMLVLPLVVRTESGLANLWGSAGILAAAGATAVAFARSLHPEGWRAVGFERGHLLRSALVAVLGYLLILPAIHGLGLVWPAVAELLAVPIEPQPVLETVAALEGGQRIQAAFLAVALMPLLEELLFRGFLQPLLVQNLREGGGITVTACLWALLHGSATAFIPLVALGIYLGTLQLRTRRLWAPWLVHALNNAITLTIVWGFPELAETLSDASGTGG